jgi:AcrR family transcriptional regulator
MPAKDDRRQQILEAAISLFASQGYYKTTTAQVAEAVGVTQPYVFHFYKSKEQLFIAVVEQSVRRIKDVFSRIEAPPEQLAATMGNAFNELLSTHRDETLLTMQSFATAEPVIRDKVRECFASVLQTVRRRFADAGLPNPVLEASLFISCGMAVAMAELLDLPELNPSYTER